jgi:glycosyltransferase involved in cell wall biosynthesis
MGNPPIRLLVVGVGPLPPEMPERLYAPGLRIWGMARELARAGHPVRLIRARFGDLAPDGRTLARRYDLAPGVEPTLDEGVDLVVSNDHGGWAALMAEEAAGFGAAAAVGSTDIMNVHLARAELEIPIWIDYFGDPMAERQMMALSQGSDEGLADQWAMMAPALARADRVSGCSADQCAALLGQLGVVGRLGRHTALTSLVRLLPPWIEPIPIDIDSPAPLRGTRAPSDAFIIIQTGGFNTWLDVKTLMTALEGAMAADERIHFACTGGAIPGHHCDGFEWFQDAVNNSPLRERFHLLGWLPLSLVPRVIQEADLGLNVDFSCPEGSLGTRNRLMDWLTHGVPVVSTPGCELADELEEAGGVTLVPHGEAQAIARAIVKIASDPTPFRQGAQEGAAYLRSRQTAEVCLGPLLKWAAAPQSASDLQAWKDGSEPPPSLATLAIEGEQAQYQALRLAWLERRLALLEGSRWVRMAMALRGRRDLDRDPPPEQL